METTEYQFAVIDSDTRQILCIPTEDGLRLPTLRLPNTERFADQVRQAMATAWGLDILVLTVLAGDDDYPSCVIAERLLAAPNSSLTPVTLMHLPTAAISDHQRSQLKQIIAGQALGSFARVGWIGEAIAWVESSTGEDLAAAHSIRQYSAGDDSALLRFETASHRFVWMKATGASQEHELKITSLLSQLASEYLPKVLATNIDWNAWLSDGGTVEKDSSTPNVIGSQLVQALAALQTKTYPHRDELLAAGAVDQQIPTLRRYVPAIFDYLEEAMSLPSGNGARRVIAGRLRKIRELLVQSMDHLQAIDMPNSILHGDLHLDNILETPSGYQFVDWCEAQIGVSSVSMEHLLLLRRNVRVEDGALSDDALRDVYCEVWGSELFPAELFRSFDYTPLVAAFSALYGRGRWFQGPERDWAPVQKYARNMARVMDTAAKAPALLRALSRPTSSQCRGWQRSPVKGVSDATVRA